MSLINTLEQGLVEARETMTVLEAAQKHVLDLGNENNQLKGDIETLNDTIETKDVAITRLRGDLDAMSMENTRLLARIKELESGQQPKPEEPDPIELELQRLPFSDNEVDNLLLNFSETAMRNWDHSGHKVPWDDPGWVKDSSATNEGYWDYLSGADPWLFDRPSVWFRMYEMVGRQQYWDQAVNDLKFYASKIDAQGYFSLKAGEQDTKYLYLAPFWWYAKTGHKGDISEYRAVIERIWNASKNGYNANAVISELPLHVLWTEREAWVHGETAYYYYLLTGNPEGLERAKAIIKQMGNGVTLVSYTQHEGGGPGGSKPMHKVSSPWMMCLYFQFARLMLGRGLDEMIYAQVINYLDFLMKPYTYTDNTGKKYEGMNGFAWGQDYHQEFKDVLTVRYLTGDYIGDAVPKEEDLMHAVEMAGFLSFARKVMLLKGRSVDSLNDLIRWNDAAVRKGLQGRVRSTISLPKYRIKPPRQWNWWVRGRYELSD